MTYIVCEKPIGEVYMSYVIDFNTLRQALEFKKRQQQPRNFTIIKE